MILHEARFVEQEEGTKAPNIGWKIKIIQIPTATVDDVKPKTEKLGRKVGPNSLTQKKIWLKIFGADADKFGEEILRPTNSAVKSRMAKGSKSFSKDGWFEP